jgi:hypothetical protein
MLEDKHGKVNHPVEKLIHKAGEYYRGRIRLEFPVWPHGACGMKRPDQSCKQGLAKRNGVINLMRNYSQGS